MDTTCRPTLHKTALRALLFAACVFSIFCAGGCAVLPIAITTGASFAMPQTASLAMTGVKGVYNTAYLASDERDMNTVLRDHMLSLKAQSALLTAQGSSDVQVYAYNGEVFAVGVVNAQEDRDRVIRAMQNVKGVGAIKGYIRTRDAEDAMSRSADSGLELRARLALGRYVLHKNSGVEVQAVDGQLCLMGVVGTHAEALDVIQYVESVTGKPALSLLSIRDEYATGHRQTNRLYLLAPGDAEPPRRAFASLNDPQPLPDAPISLARAASADSQTTGQADSQAEAAPAEQPAMAVQQPSATDSNNIRMAATPPPSRTAPARVAPARLAPMQAANAPLPARQAFSVPAVNKTRAHMRDRIAAMAQREANPAARAELLDLAARVAQDRDLSISDRLSVAADAATQQQSKARIMALLAQF
jgi:osmotically-inducible protein OsmY